MMTKLAQEIQIEVIEVDIGGHLPIPLGPSPLSLFNFSVSLIIAQFTIFVSFSGPELPKPFRGPKRCFLGIKVLVIS